MRLVLLGLALGLAAFACSPAAKPKPALQADQALPSEVDDADASAAAWAHEGDGDGGTGEGGSALAASGSMQGNEEGAKALISQFVSPTADHAALTRSLKPTSADYKALFDAATAPKIESAQAKDWESGKAVIKPGDGQTEVKIVSATGADLVAWKGAAKEFPGGYRKIAKHLVPTMTFFRFKFTKPGEDTGTAYDGLAFVNGHWVIASKPYRALDGKGGLDEAAGDDAASKPGKKPKPKGKKKK